MAKQPAKSEDGEFDKFKSFMTRLVAVPRAEIQAKLAAEKAAKRDAKAASASRVPVSVPTPRSS